MKVERLSFALVLGALLACKQAGVQSSTSSAPETPPPEPKATPLGQGLFAASCTDKLASCYSQATQACPGGFDVIDGNDRSATYTSTSERGTGYGSGNAASVNTQGSSTSSTSTTRELIIRCKSPEAAVPNTSDAGVATSLPAPSARPAPSVTTAP